MGRPGLEGGQQNAPAIRTVLVVATGGGANVRYAGEARE